MGSEPEAGGRKRQEPKEMTSDDLAAAFGLATRLRAHEVDWQLDAILSRWLCNALEELKTRNWSGCGNGCRCTTTRPGKPRCSGRVRR